MEEKFVKKMTVACILFSVAAGVFLYLSSSGVIPLVSKTSVEKMTGVEMLDYYSQADVESENMEDLIKIKLPDNVNPEDVTIKNNYVKCTLIVEIPGISENYFYEQPIVGNTEHINDLVYTTTTSGAGFEITFDTVFEFETVCENGEYEIHFIDPHEIYDQIVVIDPGHGGTSSPGTVRNDIRESDIDLAIGLYLQEMLKDSEIGVYFTRTADVDTGLYARVNLANNLDADLFISIHNNANNSTKMDDSTGTEVLYNELDTTGASQALAQICEEEVTAVLGSRSRGVNSGSEVYIIRSSKVPVALIEVGFMSNTNELKLLNSEDYQKKAAEGIKNAIVRALEEGL